MLIFASLPYRLDVEFTISGKIPLAVSEKESSKNNV